MDNNKTETTILKECVSFTVPQVICIYIHIYTHTYIYICIYIYTYSGDWWSFSLVVSSNRFH